ncbi:probable folate-biopterin transporter 8, chloroplastic isoform X1 [Coffea arabica]|uniref:Probable folate-biopterin transporter 8, chloroplastic isoform X1 n=1 Tax=Coffea arabica TaxID=13443 RepID=A0A6P6WTZ1_COFAR
MLSTLVFSGKPVCSRIQNPRKDQSRYHSITKIQSCQQQNPNTENSVSKFWTGPRPKPHLINPLITTTEQNPVDEAAKNGAFEGTNGSLQKGFQQMLALCGFGYWVNGFRCFPWLGLNFHMASNLCMQPSNLQMVQNFGSLPMVAKPLYGVLSDALYIGRARRIPYVSIGVFLQVLSWGSLALIPVASEALSILLACVLLSNLGASIAEVAKDALVAEYGQKNKMPGLQSYAFMALAAGGILGNLLGGYFLLQTQQPKSMFLSFSVLLAFQLTITLGMKEDSLGLPQTSSHSLVRKSISESIRKQYFDLLVAAREESISRPLIWIVASTATVPILSGSIFCYQTQCLNLDPSVIGMSKVIGQLMLLVMTVSYDRLWKHVPMRKLVGIVQILYASSVLLDLILVTQVNLWWGIPNEAFVFCFSGVAETLAQFKLLPFHVLFASLAPPGCEGSLMSFLASALCLSSIASGFFGVGFASVIGITSNDYTSLPTGIVMQFLAALLPLLWINRVPATHPSAEKESKKGRSRRTRRTRRVGRVGFGSIYSYRREREPDFLR